MHWYLLLSIITPFNLIYIVLLARAVEAGMISTYKRSGVQVRRGVRSYQPESEVNDAKITILLSLTLRLD